MKEETIKLIEKTLKKIKQELSKSSNLNYSIKNIEPDYTNEFIDSMEIESKLMIIMIHSRNEFINDITELKQNITIKKTTLELILDKSNSIIEKKYYDNIYVNIINEFKNNLSIIINYS